jgi:hypothetical protein
MEMAMFEFTLPLALVPGLVALYHHLLRDGIQRRAVWIQGHLEQTRPTVAKAAAADCIAEGGEHTPKTTDRSDDDKFLTYYGIRFVAK